jgi:hypothetical protein
VPADVANAAAVEQGPDGALWAITDDDGGIIRIAPGAG